MSESLDELMFIGGLHMAKCCDQHDCITYKWFGISPSDDEIDYYDTPNKSIDLVKFEIADQIFYSIALKHGRTNTLIIRPLSDKNSQFEFSLVYGRLKYCLLENSKGKTITGLDLQDRGFLNKAIQTISMAN